MDFRYIYQEICLILNKDNGGGGGIRTHGGVGFQVVYIFYLINLIVSKYQWCPVKNTATIHKDRGY